jgi:hypothetical protein
VVSLIRDFWVTKGRHRSCARQQAYPSLTGAGWAGDDDVFSGTLHSLLCIRASAFDTHHHTLLPSSLLQALRSRT